MIFILPLIALIGYGLFIIFNDIHKTIRAKRLSAEYELRIKIRDSKENKNTINDVDFIDKTEYDLKKELEQRKLRSEFLELKNEFTELNTKFNAAGHLIKKLLDKIK